MQIYIFGAGDFARETAQLAKQCGYTVDAFVADTPALWNTRVNNIAVIPLVDVTDSVGDRRFVVAIGEPNGKASVMKRLDAIGFQYATLIHPSVILDDGVTIGAGSIICAGCIIKLDVSLGRGVILNLATTVGHDCTLENYVSVMPGANISGNVHIREGAYIGTGASIRNGKPGEPMVIGASAVVGMGAVVVKPVADGMTVVGNPAAPR